MTRLLHALSTRNNIGRAARERMTTCSARVITSITSTSACSTAFVRASLVTYRVCHCFPTVTGADGPCESRWAVSVVGPRPMGEPLLPTDIDTAGRTIDREMNPKIRFVFPTNETRRPIGGSDAARSNVLGKAP